MTDTHVRPEFETKLMTRVRTKLAVLARANVGAVSCIPCYMCMCMCMRYVLAALAAAPWEWLI